MINRIGELKVVKKTIVRRFQKGQAIRYVGNNNMYGRIGSIDGFTSPTRYRVILDGRGYTVSQNDIEALSGSENG